MFDAIRPKSNNYKYLVISLSMCQLPTLYDTKIRGQLTSYFIMLMLGTREAKCFEPLIAISNWLLSNPNTDWLDTKPDPSMIGFVPQYQL